MIWALMVSPLSQRWLIFTNLGQGLSQKVVFFLLFEPILRTGSFDEMLPISNKKSGFFGCSVFSQFC